MLNWIWGNTKVVCESADWLCRQTNGLETIRNYIPDPVEFLVMPVLNYTAECSPVAKFAIGTALSGPAMYFAYQKYDQPINDFIFFDQFIHDIKMGYTKNAILWIPFFTPEKIASRNNQALILSSDLEGVEIFKALLEIPTVRNSSSLPNILHIIINRNTNYLHFNYNSDYQQEKTISLLLEIEHLRHSICSDDDNALLRLVELGNFTTFKMILEAIEPNNISQTKLEKILMMSIEKGFKDILLHLFKIESFRKRIDLNNGELLLKSLNLSQVNISKMILGAIDLNQISHSNLAKSLMVCIEKGFEDISMHLLKFESLRKNIDFNNGEPLLKSLKLGLVNTAKVILEIMEPKNSTTSALQKALKLSVKKGFLDIVKSILGNSMLSEKHFSLIHLFTTALKEQQLPIAHMLFEYTSVKKNADQYENLALITAIQNGSLYFTEALLKIESVHSQASMNSRALSVAAQNGHHEIVKLLLQIPGFKENAGLSNNQVTRLAALKNHDEIVTTLMHLESVKSNLAFDNNFMLRHYALMNNNEICSFLLTIPAIKDSVDDTFFNVLKKCTEFKDNALFKLFFECKNVPSFVHLEDNFLLAQYAVRNDLEVVNLLLEVPSVRELAAVNQNLILHQSSNSKAYEVFKRLLQVEEVGLCNRFHPHYLSKRSFAHQKALEDGKSKIWAVKGLKDYVSPLGTTLPEDMIGKILSFAYHDEVCGNRGCHFKVISSSTDDRETSCRKITRLYV